MLYPLSYEGLPSEPTPFGSVASHVSTERSDGSIGEVGAPDRLAVSALEVA